MAIPGAGASISGINASIFRQNVNANNISNLNTTAFKASRVLQTDQVAGGQGVGTAPTAPQRSGTRGSFQLTGNPTDLALTGDSFFRLEGNNGESRFTRSGNFSVDGSGRLVHASGARLNPNIQIPNGATNVRLDSNGQVTAVVAGENTSAVIGEIQPVRFANAAGLQAEGENLFSETPNSGPPIAQTLGPGGSEIQSGFLESSNVDLTEAFTQSIINTRTLEANVSTFRVQDEMTGTVIDLVR